MINLLNSIKRSSTGGFSMNNGTRLLNELAPGSRLLFIRLRSLGDVILSTPLYTALKIWRPDLQLSVLVETPYDEVLKGNPALSSILAMPAKIYSWQQFNLNERWKMLLKIRREHFDCCINLHGGSTSAWITLMSRARHRVGLHDFRNAFCYNNRIKVPKFTSETHWHSVRYQMEWLYQLGLPETPIPPLQLFPDPKSKSKINARLKQAGLFPHQPYCAIQPSSRFYTKEWTESGFAEIIDHLQERFGYSTALVGDAKETSKLRRIASLCRTSPITLGELSILDLIWVLKQAKMYIGNDCGPTHLAAALGLPTIVLFGPSDSTVWYPWQVEHEIVQNTFECNPCPFHRCYVYDEPKCILSITPGHVKEAIKRLLIRVRSTTP